MTPTYSIFAIALAIQGTAHATDQSGDAAVVASFLASMERGDQEGARLFIASDVYVGDYAQTRRTELEKFYAYARPCRLRSIQLVATDTPLPIGVTWSCRYPDTDRDAAFWIRDGKISRIGWGPRPVIRVPSLRVHPSVDRRP